LFISFDIDDINKLSRTHNSGNNFDSSGKFGIWRYIRFRLKCKLSCLL